MSEHCKPEPAPPPPDQEAEDWYDLESANDEDDEEAGYDCHIYHDADGRLLGCLKAGSEECEFCPHRPGLI